jgi:hypothetical protein
VAVNGVDLLEPVDVERDQRRLLSVSGSVPRPRRSCSIRCAIRRANSSATGAAT